MPQLNSLGVWPEYLHLGNWNIHLPSLVPYIALVGMIGFILLILPGLIWIERVVLALIQDRSGPNRVGPRGLLQSTADVVKIFFKEDTRPRNVDVRVYYLAPAIGVITAFSAGATLPLQTLTFERADHTRFTIPLTIGDVNMGLLYILAMSSLQVYGVVLAGWSSNNKYSLLGGLRAAAQLISYELSMGLALLCGVMLAGSLKLSDIVEAQNVLPFPGAPEFLRGSIVSWFWLKSLIVPVILYTIAMVAETNRAPFDLPEAESELVAGFFTEYTSMKFAMFFTAEYIAMMVVSGLNAAVFWGGPLPPINMLPFTLLPGFVWFITKVMMGIMLYVWLRGTLPRLRYDALMNLGWKWMLPIGLVWLFVLAGVNLATDIALPAQAKPLPKLTDTATILSPELATPQPAPPPMADGQMTPKQRAMLSRPGFGGGNPPTTSSAGAGRTPNDSRPAPGSVPPQPNTNPPDGGGSPPSSGTGGVATPNSGNTASPPDSGAGAAGQSGSAPSGTGTTTTPPDGPDTPVGSPAPNPGGENTGG